MAEKTTIVSLLLGLGLLVCLIWSGPTPPSAPVPSSSPASTAGATRATGPGTTSSVPPKPGRDNALNLLDHLAASDDRPGPGERAQLERILFSDAPLTARMGALRVHLERVGPEGLPALLPLFRTADEEPMIQTLGHAFGAGGDPKLANALLDLSTTDDLTPTGRITALTAAWEIGDRHEFPDGLESRIVARLLPLARTAPEHLEPALAAFTEAPHLLDRIATETSRAQTRALAAYHLSRRAPQRARPHFERLADDADPDIADFATAWLRAE